MQIHVKQNSSARKMKTLIYIMYFFIIIIIEK